MASVRLTLPIGWKHPRGLKELQCDAPTVAVALDRFITLEPLLKPRIKREGHVWVGVFLNGRNVQSLQGLETQLTDGDVLTVLSPLSGG